MGIRIDKVKNDKDIKQINVDNFKDQPKNIKLIGNITQNKKGPIIRGIILTIVAIALCAVTIAGVFLFVNYKFIQGNVVGKNFDVAGWSVVSKDYDPLEYAKVGSKVYYSTASIDRNQEFSPSDTFKIAMIVTLGKGDKITITDNGYDELHIPKSQVYYIVEGQ